MKIETKLDIGDKIYFVYGDPKKHIVVFSGIINKINIFEDSIMYNFNQVKMELDKDKIFGSNAKLYEFGFFYEKYLNSEKAPRFGFSYPVFSSKQKCIEYLRRVKKSV